MDPEALRERLRLEKMMGVAALPRRASSPAAEELARIEAEVMRCTACRLHKERTQGVFARGDPTADLMFIGEAPGREEDLQGEPFVGPAGQLLDQMVRAMGLERDEVYITNILKSRPPGNRDPRADEVEACWPFLERQIEVVAPRIICTLGRPASNTLLGGDRAMGQMRGRWHSFRGVPVMPTYHPAYLLRSPGQKKRAWQDLKQIVVALAEGVPGSPGLF